MQSKFIKILSVILVSLILILLFDAVFYLLSYRRIVKTCTKLKIPSPPFRYTYIPDDFETLVYPYETEHLRKPDGLQYKKPPILVFGCSFAYGHYLKEDEIFSHLLSEYTKRPVYNKARPGNSIQHMIYRLQHDSFPENFKPEYIVYVMIDDHYKRLYEDFLVSTDNFYNLGYVLKNGTLIEKQHKIPFPESLCIVRKIKNNINQLKFDNPKYFDTHFDFAKLHFETAAKLAETKFPGVKLIILMYDKTHSFQARTPRLKELESIGFKVISTNELTDEELMSSKYTLPDGHPSAEAWKLLTPRFADKAGIK